MGDRQENLKKTLCISEYPWSSDDEEHTPPPSQPQPQPLSLVQEIMPEENRQSTGDRPGTSSLTSENSPQLSAARRNQSRVDRDLFWSYLSSNLPSINRSRSEANRDQWTRQSDLRRILAFKRINPPGSGPQASRSATSLFAIRRAAQANMDRMGGLGLSSTGASALSGDLAAGAFSGAAGTNVGERVFGSASLEEPAQQAGPSSSGLHFPRLSFHVDRNVNNAQPVVEPHSPDQSDDDVEMTGVTAPPLDLHDDEPNEDETPHAAEISLEEEIVEIEGGGAEEGDAEPTGERATDNTDGPNPAQTEQAQEIAHPNASSDSSASHGVKRKRNSVECDPATVKEFNQRLLRVLECPVCLEWMEPPMSQCRRGHLICNRCRARISACPVCRCAFSSVRNRAMETVAEMLRYPCRHGCGREVRLRRRGPHEASCPARCYRCVAPACANAPPMPLDQLPIHVQNQHISMLKIGPHQRVTIRVHSEAHDNWLVVALRKLFHLRIDVGFRSWGINVHVAYIGPQKYASNFIYEVTVVGQHDSRRMVYTRATHCDLENPSSNVFRHDCFALSLDQALHFLRSNSGDSDKCLHLDIEIKRSEATEQADSDS